MNTRPGEFSCSKFSTRRRSARIAIPIFSIAALCAALAFSELDSRAADAAQPNAALWASAGRSDARALAGQEAVDANKILPVVMFTTWRDPQEGAFTVSVPKDWQTSGGANRRSNVDITLTVRTGTADGRVKMFVNDADIVPHEVPNQMTNMAGMREGQTIQGAWGGPVLLARFQTGQQFAQNYVAQRLCPGASFTGGALLQKETADMNAQARPYADAAGAMEQSSAGEIYFRCGQDFGYATATTLLVGPRGPGVAMWFVWQISGFTVKNEVDGSYAMYILHTMNSTFKLDPQWEARSQQAADAMTASITNMQHAIAANLQQQAAARAQQDRASVVHGNNIDVMSGWEARNKSHDAAMQKDSDVRRGVTTTEDPVWGSRQVSNSYNYYWTRPDGSIIRTTTSTPPTADGGGWRIMANH
jgi:hypothetical protein